MSSRRASLPQRDVMSRGSSRPESSEPKVKGVAFRSVLAILAQLRGEPFVECVLRKMSTEQAHALRYTVVQTGWYPIALYRALWAAILWECPDGYTFVRTVGGAAIRRDVGGVYRVLFKVLSIDSLLTLSSKLFPYYYDTGSIRNERIAGDRIRSIYEGCVGFDRAMWEELAGSCAELIRMAGAKDVHVGIVRGGQDHSSACVMQIEWR